MVIRRPGEELGDEAGPRIRMTPALGVALVALMPMAVCRRMAAAMARRRESGLLSGTGLERRLRSVGGVLGGAGEVR
jgi:hypothetical protein